jgi:glycosyltransferase involved in cell wall biosynthesis
MSIFRSEEHKTSDPALKKRWLNKFRQNHGVSAPRLRLFSLVNFRKYLWYCRLYGLKNATKLAFRRLVKPDDISNLVINPLSLPDLQRSFFEESLPLIDKKISVVIPTWNAGGEFSLLLRKLKAQKGIRECEIIIVDSGSTDDTLRIAREEGVEIAEISLASFDHAFSRNKGAERATGDYVLFTVQDALPLTDRWLWEMAGALEQNDIVAVSCAEYPRSDCDLFYRLLIWNHYRTLNLDKDRILAWNESCSSHMGLRSNGQISDIAALIRRDVFNKYKYKTKYAEDIDLGIRLIRDGHKIGFLYSTRVLHSHNRPAYYFLKRAYVDARFLVEVFPDYPLPAVDNQQRILRCIVSLYGRTNYIANLILSQKYPVPIGRLLDQIRNLYMVNNGETTERNHLLKDDQYEAIIQKLREQPGIQVSAYGFQDNILLPHLLNHFEQLRTYLTPTYELADEKLARDLAVALCKMSALHSGTHLAYLYLTLASLSRLNPYAVELDKTLKAGV